MRIDAGSTRSQMTQADVRRRLVTSNDILATMKDRYFLTARMDADGGPETSADQKRVPWWSFTKTALATAALQLVARGHFSLDDPIDGRPYTLRQLLQHRAGVPNNGGLASYREAVRLGEKPWGVEQMLDRVGADRLDFEPGRGWCYSNVGYLFVRQSIEDATGHDIGSALRHLVFDALGLDSVRLVTAVDDLADGRIGATAANMILDGSIMAFWPDPPVMRCAFCTSSCRARCCRPSF
jgi:CubicO group peptidase (beta-lactamase class C family)